MINSDLGIGDLCQGFVPSILFRIPAEARVVMDGCVCILFGKEAFFSLLEEALCARLLENAEKLCTLYLSSEKPSSPCATPTAIAKPITKACEVIRPNDVVNVIRLKDKDVLGSHSDSLQCGCPPFERKVFVDCVCTVSDLVCHFWGNDLSTVLLVHRPVRGAELKLLPCIHFNLVRNDLLLHGVEIKHGELGP